MTLFTVDNGGRDDLMFDKDIAFHIGSLFASEHLYMCHK